MHKNTSHRAMKGSYDVAKAIETQGTSVLMFGERRRAAWLESHIEFRDGGGIGVGRRRRRLGCLLCVTSRMWVMVK
jgi:hypothetical protein